MQTCKECKKKDSEERQIRLLTTQIMDAVKVYGYNLVMVPTLLEVVNEIIQEHKRLKTKHEELEAVILASAEKVLEKAELNCSSAEMVLRMAYSYRRVSEYFNTGERQ
jgi:hemoglobin-like flavoprotein